MPGIKHAYSTKKNSSDTCDLMNVTGKENERVFWSTRLRQGGGRQGGALEVVRSFVFPHQ